MIRVLLRKVNKNGTVGMWFARTNPEFRELSPNAYKRCVSTWKTRFKDFTTRTYAVNICNHSLHIWFKI